MFSHPLHLFAGTSRKKFIGCVKWEFKNYNFSLYYPITRKNYFEMKNQLFLIFSALVLFSGCFDPLEKTPSSSNADKAIQQFYQDTLVNSYSDEQKVMMETITSFLGGKKSFEEKLGVVYDSENFDTTYSNFIENLEVNELSYYDLLHCNSFFWDQSRQKTGALSPLGREIQDECEKRQAEIDEVETVLANSMSSSVTGPYTNADTHDGKFVEFKVIDRNLTNKVISGRTVRIRFFDGFNKLVHSVDLSGSNPFRNTEVGYLRYFKNESPEDYNKFANLKRGSFKVETENRILNIGGNMVAYPAYSSINFKHEVFSETSTYCPYLVHSDVDEPLLEEVKAVEQKYDDRIENECDHYIRTINIFDGLENLGSK